MIDKGAQAELDRFIAHWSKHLAPAPELALDLSWPSVGVIDALTFALRKKQDFNDFESQLVRGCSAYLGAIAQKCWATFEVHSTLELTADGIVLLGKGGAALGAGEAEAYIERDLANLLHELPERLQIFSTFERLIPEADNFISHFAFGLFVGLLPTIEGPWSKETPQSWTANVVSAVKHLAATCADQYARLFPDEKLGQLPELYFSELIYPLTMMTEELPLRRAVHGLLGFFDEYKLKPAGCLKLSLNLMRMADERISDTGFVCAAALSESVDAANLRAVGSSRSVAIGLMRRAMHDVRTKLLGQSDWLEKGEYSEADKKQIVNEMRLRFFPWSKLSAAKIIAAEGDEELRRMLKALGEFNLRTANLIVDELIDLVPDDMEYRLQKVYLELLSGDLPLAEASLKSLMSEPLSENQPLIFDLMGTIQIFKRDLQSAEMFLKRARSITCDDPLVKSDLRNNFGWMLMLKGDFEGALELFNEALDLNPDALMALLNKTTALHQMHRYEEAAVVDRRLLKLVPMNREVFRGLIFDPGTK